MPCDSENNDMHSHDQALQKFCSGLHRKSTHPQSLLIAPDLTPNEGVEKPDSEPGIQQREIVFSKIVCHEVAPHASLIRFTAT